MSGFTNSTPKSSVFDTCTPDTRIITDSVVRCATKILENGKILSKLDGERFRLSIFSSSFTRQRTIQSCTDTDTCRKTKYAYK